MITNASRYHGAVFSLLLERSTDCLGIRRLADVSAGFYLVNECLPLYLKHSTRRHGPWTFNFFRHHQETQQRLHLQYGECITGLVCGKDGVVGMQMQNLREVLDENFEEQECISVRRKLNRMYEVRGRDGRLAARVGRTAVFDLILELAAA